MLKHLAATQGAVGALLVAGGIYLKAGLWAALVTLGVFMLVDVAMRGRS